MRSFRPLLAGVAAAAIAATAASLMGAASAAPTAHAARGGADNSLRAFGLTTDQRLIQFRTNAPGNVSNVGEVSGLVGDDRLVGIDFRVQDGRLYGVGDAGGVYTLRTGTAAAAKVSQLTVALAGVAVRRGLQPRRGRAARRVRHRAEPAPCRERGRQHDH